MHLTNFSKGMLYLIRENNFVLRQNCKQSIKRKGHTRNTRMEAYASKYIDSKGTDLIGKDVRINERSTKMLCTYNINHNSFEKLTSLPLAVKETMYTTIRLKSNPIYNVDKFIQYLIRLCNFDTKNDTFNPSVNIVFTQNDNIQQVKIPIIKLNNGYVTNASKKAMHLWLKSANYQLTKN